MTTVASESIRQAAAQLGDTSDTPRLDAEILMAHALGIARETLLLTLRDAVTPDGFEALVARRRRGAPMAYITGTRDFWSITLKVGPGALVPRPDSETLIEAALDHFGAKGPRTILDLGTGPGTLLLAALAEWPEATGLGVDISEEALAYARTNVAALGMASRAELRLGNWAEGVDARFDLVLANPPYIETGTVLPRDVAAYEPHQALFAGADGLDDYRILAGQLGAIVAPGGMAAVEIGSGQRAAVTALFAATGLDIESRCDLAGRDRAILLYHR
ncbi:peptide chain release factor N(5)-glutamine methyltransferase [Sphingobium boeckii]|uniref:Release factor glutamine methyltransferase n=1 Tax=Sphingobium boeckii TaxID=1082345 RepID=A0A7W9AEP0_9SPHN|nr:peptide chain release factor N(5)-glutamine methyltransferase [Sphingobium boeckii]MBB5684254.1 release factor glutamine methyltransferase [Sphingobium boeckii]